jgi:putative hydrolase
MMKDIGKRIEFHTHSLFSDGMLLPAEIIHMAKLKDFAAIAITDHVDPSNIKTVLNSLNEFVKECQGRFEVPFIPGVELSYVEPARILHYADQAKKLGAKIVIVHGETPAEDVPKGTNKAGVTGKGVIDILAHPGFITEEEVNMAKENNIYLEITSKKGHSLTNGHVAKLAQKIGAKMLVASDMHAPEDLIDQATAFKVAKASGLSEAEALKVITDNPKELYLRITASKI